MSSVTAIRPYQEAPSVPRSWWPGWGLVVLALGVAASAVLGPLVLDVIRYHASDGAVTQISGGDVAALLLVAPVATLAGILLLRGHPAGAPLGMAPAVYAVYTYTQLALGGDFARYPGNSEDFFLLNLGLFVLGIAITISCWSRIDVDRLPDRPRVDRFLAGYLALGSLFLLIGLHLPHLIALWTGGTPEGYVEDPGVFWLVKLMDLGLILPAMIGVAIGLLRGRGWAQKAKYAMVGWFALLGTAVAGMAIVMQLTDAPGAEIANVIGMGAIAVIGLLFAWALYRPLFSPLDRG